VRILVVGGGGREHALVWAIRRESPDAAIYCAPGNPGTGGLATNLPIAPTDLDRLADAADAYGIDLTIVGPEAPLAEGLADRLRAEGRAVFGPSRSAAQIEASKAFAKEIMGKAGVSTAASGTFTALREALAFVDRQTEPLVVKASGLAAGKGAMVCATRGEARAAVTAMLDGGRFGTAGQTVIVEEFMPGEELSLLAITDGAELVLLPAAQDHKRLGEGDTGPNTGGMGAYSPVTLATPSLLARAEQEIFIPTLRQLSRQGVPYNGVLYAGLMVGPDGSLRVVEFNCRLGDPEAQAVLPLVGSGLVDCLWRVARGEAPSPLSIMDAHAVTTVLAARGYPDQPEKGAAITLPQVLPEGVVIFHAGTSRDADGTLRVSGGRVLTVTAVATSFADAQAQSREAAAAIHFDGKVYRRDIGWREVVRQKLGV